MRTEKKILNKALATFGKTTGLNMVIKTLEYTDNTGHRADALIELVTPSTNIQFIGEVKARLTRGTLLGAVQQLRVFEKKVLIVTDYVNPVMAERLVDMNIQFIDVAGNAYINEPPLLIYIKGKKPTKEIHIKPPARTFRGAGLKVVFALLCQPELTNATYRDIAKKAGVALGTAGEIVNELIRMKFIVDMGKRGRRLLDKKKLLDRWVEAYPEQLRPKLILGRYDTAIRDTLIHDQIKEYNAYWGGEVAAFKLTKYIKPKMITIYAAKETGRLILRNKLKKNPNGDVEILNTFWNFRYEWRHHDLTPPLLIYADLLATGDERNIETARKIYEKELIELIRED